METVESMADDANTEDRTPDLRDDESTLSEMVGALRRELSHQAETRPYTTLMVSAAAGYVLGAGVPRWAAQIATAVGSRMVVAKLVSALVDER
ncbi:MAG: hypothetical protein ABMB14_06885 [Myxococcota bacterium]